MSNIERKYTYYDEGVLPEEGEYGVTYLTLYSSNAGNVYDGWIWDPEHKTAESAIERTFGFRNPNYPNYCYDDEVVVDLSNAQNREESSEFSQGRITSFNTNVSSTPIILEDIDITGLTEEERERKATTVLFSAIPLVDDSYIQAMIEVQCKVNISPDNTTGIVRVEAFYILNDESDRTMRPNPVHTFSVSSPNERHTLPWLYWNPALKHEDNNYIGVKLIATGGTVEIGISDDPDYGDAMITLTSAGLTGDNIFSGKPIDLEIFGKEEAVPGYKLDINDYTVLCTYDTGEVYEVTHMCDYSPEMGTALVDPTTVLTAMYQGLEASMIIYLATIAYIDIEGVDEFHGSMELELGNYTVTAYFDSGDVVEVTSACAFNPNMGTVLTEDTTLTAYYIPVFDIINSWTDPIGRYGQGNIDLYNRPMYIQPDDGTISTVNSMSFNDEGLEVLIPTIGRDEKGNPIQMEDDEAINYYYETGEYLGKFNTVQEADSYGEQLHLQQEYIYDLEKGYSCELDITAIPVFGSTYDIDENPTRLIYTIYDDGWSTITGKVAVYDGEQFIDPETGDRPVFTVYYETDPERQNPIFQHEQVNFAEAAGRILAEKGPGATLPQIKSIFWEAEGAPMGVVNLCGPNVTNSPERLYGFENMDTSFIGDIQGSLNPPHLEYRYRGLLFQYNSKLHDKDFAWLKNVDTSKIICMEKMFIGCEQIRKVDFLEDWDVSNVVTMEKMFEGSDLREQQDSFEFDMHLENLKGLRKWKLTNVTNMSLMFADCNHIEYLTALSSWRTPKGVDCSYMFLRCIELKGVSGLGNISPSSVVQMFTGCSKLKQVVGLASLDLSKCTSLASMFADSGLEDITGVAGWQVSHITAFTGMFMQTNIKDPSPANSWNISGGVHFGNMFGLIGYNHEDYDYEKYYLPNANSLDTYGSKVNMTLQLAGLTDSNGHFNPSLQKTVRDETGTHYWYASTYGMFRGTDLYIVHNWKDGGGTSVEFIHPLPNWYKDLITAQYVSS